MAHDRVNWLIKARRSALALAAAALPFACLDSAAVHAQSIMRTPNLNIGSRVPTINPTVTPRINPNIAGRTSNNVVGRTSNIAGINRVTPRVTVTTTAMRPTPPSTMMRPTPRIGVTSTLPYARYSPNLYPACGYAYRDGECQEKPISSADGGGNGSKSAKTGKKNNGPSGNAAQTALNTNAITGELVAEIDGSLTSVQADELARRYRLERISSQDFPLIGATIGLFRIIDRRPVEIASREFATAAEVRSVQLNFRYLLQEQKAAPAEGDPAQYAVAKLRLAQAHALAHGANVTIAVIDSGIDAKHPELANSIADNFDALGSKEGAHAHGTGIAGAIVSHARLMGSAPQARILGIRAFGVAPNGAESTSFVILKALNYAVEHGAQIINMSFAGPKDMLIERGIAATAARGIVLVAASGNAGPKSSPLYPAANPNVIAVSATDAQDRLFTASNRGSHIAIAAPGVDIFLPAPDEKYQMTSGTSFSAAYVSGLAALILERNPALKPGEVRAILVKTARDLGAPGRDDLFGAGEADAFAAVNAVVNTPAVPMAAAPANPAPEKASDRQDITPTRALNQPAAAMASDKSAVSDANQPAAQ
jgi:subtilisin family serine protease